ATHGDELIQEQEGTYSGIRAVVMYRFVCGFAVGFNQIVIGNEAALVAEFDEIGELFFLDGKIDGGGVELPSRRCRGRAEQSLVGVAFNCLHQVGNDEWKVVKLQRLEASLWRQLAEFFV